MFTAVLFLALSSGDVVQFGRNDTYATKAECAAHLPAFEAQAAALLERHFGVGERGKSYQFELKCMPVKKADTI